MGRSKVSLRVDNQAILTVQGLRSPRFWVGIAVSVLCLFLAVRNVPLADLGRMFNGAAYGWLVPVLAFQLLAVMARARRWAILLRRPDLTVDSFWAQGIGYLFTNLFPLRLGEVARVAVMTRRGRLPVGQVIATVVIERALDVATIVGLLAITIPFMRVPSYVQRAGELFGLAVLTLPLLLFGIIRNRSRVDRVLRWGLGSCRLLPAERILDRWHEVIDGLGAVVDLRIALGAVFWSIVTWAFSVGTYWCTLRAFKSTAALIESTFMVVSLSLAVAVPSSPGFIGVFQFIGEQALVIPFGGKYTDALALAITLMANVIYYVLTSSIGIIALLRFRESLQVIDSIHVRGPTTG